MVRWELLSELQREVHHCSQEAPLVLMISGMGGMTLKFVILNKFKKEVISCLQHVFKIKEGNHLGAI